MSKSLTFKAGILAFANASQKLIMLILAIILSRYLSVSDYGSYQQLIIIYFTLITIISFGLPLSINYFLPRSESKEEKKAYVVQTYFLLLGLGLIFAIIFFFLSGFISKQFNNPELNELIKIFVWFIFFLTPIQFINQLLVVLDKTKKLAIYRISFACLRLLSVIIPILMKANLKIIVIFLVGFSIIQFIISTIIIFKPFVNIKSSWKKSFLGSQLKYSLYLGLSSIVGILLMQIDKIVISLFFIPSIFAVYANGAREVPLIGILVGSVMAILIPEFVKLYKEKNIKKLLILWHNSIRKVALILFPISAFLFLFSEEFIVTLFSLKYLASANIFRIYLLLIPLKITQFGAILMSINKTKIIFKSSIYALILNIILNLLFVKFFGVVGPAIATVLIFYILITYRLYYIKKYLKINFYDILPWKKISKIGLICIIPLILVFFVKMLNVSYLIKFIIGVIIYFFMYSMIIIKLKKVSLRDFKLFFK